MSKRQFSNSQDFGGVSEGLADVFDLQVRQLGGAAYLFGLGAASAIGGELVGL